MCILIVHFIAKLPCEPRSVCHKPRLIRYMVVRKWSLSFWPSYLVANSLWSWPCIDGGFHVTVGLPCGNVGEECIQRKILFRRKLAQKVFLWVIFFFLGGDPVPSFPTMKPWTMSYDNLAYAYCFSGVLDDMEYACYNQWFDHILKKEPPHIDLIGMNTNLSHTG